MPLVLAIFESLGMVLVCVALALNIGWGAHLDTTGLWIAVIYMHLRRREAEQREARP